MLSGPRHRPLGHRHSLEHAFPQLEAPTLISKVLTFTVQDVLRLRQGLVSHAHGFTHGDVARARKGWNALGPPSFPRRWQPPRRRSRHRANDDHGPLHWNLLPYHLWHRLWCHLRLLLRILHHVFRDSLRGPGLTDWSLPRSHPDSCICGSSAYDRSSCAHRGGRARGRGPGQKV
jgi:hypothetical protein